ncbi:dihydropteroate synthase [Microbacterium algeriense]|jgi:dihydropteroate synthase|uniref:Dihydropteroate synthase n=1 Tax=Microbacterium algeriense TaxID=2615184 RepID=A0ABQ6V4S6_9MICO|nr:MULTISPECIES: dihydropteroate synthase [Microbacterium]KAB1862454.1 dihydropteroate synthase [Microbacterium algeriense]
MTGIWGIVNVTPDSFSDGGRYLDVDAAVAHGLRLRADGAAVLDVGGESTRPGAERVGTDVEQQRVIPVIEQLAAAGVPVSIDTLSAETAAAAVRAGARIVNDVSGGLADPDMRAAVAESGADFAIGHWRGFSADMYAHAEYRRVAREVAGELQERMGEAAAAGIAPSRLILDPGIGFAKAGTQNWDVLRGLDEIIALGPRVLIGTSRKRFLAEVLRGEGGQDEEVSEARRDLATAVTSALAVRAGVWAVRVHDVSATRDALAVAHAWEG